MQKENETKNNFLSYKKLHNTKFAINLILLWTMRIPPNPLYRYIKTRLLLLPAQLSPTTCRSKSNIILVKPVIYDF